MHTSLEPRSPSAEAKAVLDVSGLDALVRALVADGRTVVGPTVREGAIVLEELTTADALPVGWGDEQDGGRYRLRRRDDAARFGYAVPVSSWERFLFPPAQILWRAVRDGDGFVFDAQPEPVARYAFLGVRACELRAIATQDRVFLGGSHPDPVYAARRDDVFVVAVNCGEPAGTCFCVSMGTGPRAGNGFDLALTELVDGDRHEFVVEVGTERGGALLASLPQRAAEPADRVAADEVVASAARRMGRTLDTDDLPGVLARNLEHPRWDDVASRCLACTNCTLVCPTCFCHAVEDTTDLAGTTAERHRRWDSCFTLDFTHLHGGSTRMSTRARYRQWLTHKLGTWWDQFGESGCVGCGRCITWCPVGIDLTEEVRAIRAADGARNRDASTRSARDP